MPRQSRTDAPGALHHIICCGIERRRIFKDDQDRDRFIEQLDGGLIRSGGEALRKIRVFIWKLPKPHKHMGVPLSLLEIVLNALDCGVIKRYHIYDAIKTPEDISGHLCQTYHGKY